MRLSMAAEHEGWDHQFEHSDMSPLLMANLASSYHPYVVDILTVLKPAELSPPPPVAESEDLSRSLCSFQDNHS